MKNLAQAVIKVMKEVKGMEKNSQVGSGNYGYKGTKDQDVKEVFNEALSKNGLCILPINITSNTKVDRWDDNGKSKQSVFTEINATYLLLHESGESQEIAGYGHGVDAQDKGAGKATTYALKNCLLYTFLTPVGKIDDTETTHSEEINIPENKKNNFHSGMKAWSQAIEKEISLEKIKTKYSITHENEKAYTDELYNHIINK